ncbi:hypothetical protein NO2_1070 [Candidatus Termititenax persephonae]|uniref:HPP transmembrane region domain-containing protein n=1 Tax=Candidatus Termititenax persephonae TaxID=2218525 RepID=A0A388THC3_9BACT|nr:hypothetical protein NO2_1070 [Candidatus Termititenax persephonae]
MGKPGKSLPCYVLQPLGAGILLALLLWGADCFIPGLVSLSIGSSAFTAAIFPRQKQSSPRNLLGGYLCGVAVGLLFFYLRAGIALPSAVWVCGAVSLTMFLMLLLDCRHAPGVSLALGVFFSGRPSLTSAAALVGIVLICLAKELNKGWMQDLG